MTNVGTGSSLHLRALKTVVPSEYASASRVRQWLLQHLKNRNVDLLNGPEAFVFLWNGAELHSLHPNHIFGSLISQGIDPQTAHHVVGDVMECLEDYRTRRAACMAAGQVWFPDPEPESDTQPKRRPEPNQRQVILDEDVEALAEHSESAQSWYSSISAAPAGAIAAGLSVAAGLGVMAWWMLSPPEQKEDDK
ncbi:hypothetical protein CkaCkLH20_04410 [Colletotrichum karsti]|uniref:Uncharacterized protein n=1 Tax=Colletotrichum karsti TaxID=1095194 RepID=A0A9P6LNB9_9PEZI|nr:uncharacterized protein CkaCkLH20_04410 [Colletotrichum karsti]KAF9878372.1 hypothetical protein CkaCkLH20_04410 [Colletotrichum karsti]